MSHNLPIPEICPATAKFSLPQQNPDAVLKELCGDDRLFVQAELAIAREILSQPAWRGFVPANATLGTLSGMEGDFVASERFFRAVFASGTEQPSVACNDFAETLRRLKKLDEAEKYAREAVAKSSQKDWVSRLTLVQILDEAKKNGDEIRVLATEALRYAPPKMRPRLREYASRTGGE